MKMPKKVVVGPFTYRISTDELELLRACHKTSRDMTGTTDHLTQKILVTKKIHPDQAAETLLHEVLHTLTWLTGIAAEMDDDEEEKLVRRIAPVLLDVLRRNPKLVEYLQKETK